MLRRASVLGSTLVVAAHLAPAQASGQAADHQHAAGTAAHSHAGPAVSCTDLASPPWSGLPDMDRQRIAAVQRSVMELSTPEAAIAAGFRPALGDIPGMGVHYVNVARSVDGIHVDAPDHLMFSPVDGRETLVGAAYAFVDAIETDEPIPFESDLAHWHDHPQFAPEGQTLHMLHVWFVPSSNGPFAGLNFWLPFHGAGITPPSACWMSDPQMADQIQRVSFALVRPGAQILRQVVGDAEEEEVTPRRQAILDDLDAAARDENLNAWIDAADRFLADLRPRERIRTQALLQALTSAQMSSTERETMDMPQDDHPDHQH